MHFLRNLFKSFKKDVSEQKLEENAILLTPASYSVPPIMNASSNSQRGIPIHPRIAAIPSVASKENIANVNRQKKALTSKAGKNKFVVDEGIRSLVAAEKSSEKKIIEARQRRVKKLKQAEKEAQLIIKAIEKKFEDEYFNSFKMIEEVRLRATAQVEKEIEKKTEAIREAAVKRYDRAINQLYNEVIKINPQLHVNYKMNDMFKDE